MKKLISVFFLFSPLYGPWLPPHPFPSQASSQWMEKTFTATPALLSPLSMVRGRCTGNMLQENNATIENFVLNGRYLVLLGGQGMQSLPANLFLENDNLFLRVRVDLQDGQGIRLLEPDQPITSTPYALAAELARLPKKPPLPTGSPQVRSPQG